MNRSILRCAVMSMMCPFAYAEEPPPASEPAPFTGNIALTNNYKFRGQDQTKNRPAIQGGFDYSHGGFYVGNWNSSINFDSSASIEMDFYAGHKAELVQGLSYDVGVLQYYYPQHDKTVDYNTTEIYGALVFGPATLKYSHTVSSDYFGWGSAFKNATPTLDPRGRNTGFLSLTANIPLFEKMTLNGAVGYTRYAKDLRDNGLPNFYDYKLGLTYDLGAGFAISGAVIGASKKGYYGEVNKTRGIVMLSKAM